MRHALEFVLLALFAIVVATGSARSSEPMPRASIATSAVVAARVLHGARGAHANLVQHAPRSLGRAQLHAGRTHLLVDIDDPDGEPSDDDTGPPEPGPQETDAPDEASDDALPHSIEHLLLAAAQPAGSTEPSASAIRACRGFGAPADPPPRA